MSKINTTTIGDACESRTARFLRRIGLDATHSKKHRGPDIQVVYCKADILIEVKKATPKNGGYSVAEVKPRRRKDHIIAVVFPKQIVFELMRTHLRKCNVGGRRTVTRLAGKVQTQQDVRDLFEQACNELS